MAIWHNEASYWLASLGNCIDTKVLRTVWTPASMGLLPEPINIKNKNIHKSKKHGDITTASSLRYKSDTLFKQLILSANQVPRTRMNLAVMTTCFPENQSNIVYGSLIKTKTKQNKKQQKTLTQNIWFYETNAESLLSRQVLALCCA